MNIHTIQQMKQQREVPPLEVVPLATWEYLNADVEERFEIQRDIYIERDPNLRRETEPNPNEVIRLVRKIFENYMNVRHTLGIMVSFLEKYKETLIFNRQNPPREDGQDNGNPMKPPMAIRKVVLMKSKEQKQAVSHAMNKLKLMVMKGRYKESSNYEYVMENYVAKLISCLKCFVKFREDKEEKSVLLEHYVSTHEFIFIALKTIKSKFDALDLRNVKYLKHGPSQYIEFLAQCKAEEREKPVLFLNFFTETLLFVERQFIGFNINLLYCPIALLGDSSMGVSGFFLKHLNNAVSEWIKYQLYVEVYHIETSLKKPVFLSKLLTKKEDFDIQTERFFPQRLRKELENLETFVNNLNDIRRCIFAKMMIHWLSNIYNSKDDRVELMFHNRFKVVIHATCEPLFYDDRRFEHDVEIRHQIITNLLIFAKDRKHLHHTRHALREQLNTLIEATLFKIIAEKSGARVSWPLQCGSLGKHHYEYMKDKPLQRVQVQKFFQNF